MGIVMSDPRQSLDSPTLRSPPTRMLNLSVDYVHRVRGLLWGTRGAPRPSKGGTSGSGPHLGGISCFLPREVGLPWTPGRGGEATERSRRSPFTLTVFIPPILAVAGVGGGGNSNLTGGWRGT